MPPSFLRTKRGESSANALSLIVINIAKCFIRSIGASAKGAPDIIVAAGPKQAVDLANFETSPLRWAFDVLLSEYRALRDEIQTLKQAMDRTYSYVLALTGAIFASQALPSLSSALEREPIIYLVGALCSLWFPAHYLTLAVEMTTAGTYVREVIQPKINNLISLATNDARTQLTMSASQMNGWSVEVGRVLTERQARNLTHPMAWEDFTPMLRYGSQARKLILMPVFFVRAFLLYAPATILGWLAVTAPKALEGIQIALLLILCLGVLLCFAAQFSLAGLIAYGLRIGPFKSRSDSSRRN